MKHNTIKNKHERTYSWINKFDFLTTSILYYTQVLTNIFFLIYEDVWHMNSHFAN